MSIFLSFIYDKYNSIYDVLKQLSSIIHCLYCDALLSVRFN